MSIISILLIGLSIYYKKHDIDKHVLNEVIDNSAQKILYIIIILSLICLVSILIPPFNIIPIWYVLSAPFVAFIPGYYIMNTLIARKEELLYLERAGLSVFISLIITSIIAVIYYVIKGYIDMGQVTIVLIALTLLIILPLYIKKIRKIDVNERFSHKKTNRALLFITIIGLLCVILVGIQVTSENLTTGNTTFEISGIEKTANDDGYVNLTNGENITSQVNITNNENKEMNYTMKIEVHNETDKILQEEQVVLKDGQSKNIPVNLTMTTGRKDIQYVLYNDDGKALFIRHLYANVEEV